MRREALHLISALLLLAAILAGGGRAEAQQGLAHAGPDGIYVDLGNYVLPASIDGRSVNAYRVERRPAKTRQWTPVADVAGPATQTELEAAFLTMQSRFGELAGVKINAPELWQRLQTARDLRTVGVATRLLPVQLALGVRWLDATADRAEAYEYRVSHVDQDGSVREAFITPPVAWPGFADVAELRMEQSSGEPTAATVEWRILRGTQPTAFRVFRREGLAGPFAELSSNVVDSCCIVAKGLFARGDTLLATVHDKTVQRGQVYQYYAVPQDYFRNEGRASDTATVVTFRMAHVPLPERMKIRSIDTAGLELRWDLRETSAIHGVVIERGPKIDSGFVELFTASPTDTSYLDVTVQPMTRYYYQLRLVGPGGLRSPASAVVIGIWKSSDMPTPPQNVRAAAVKGGVRLEWDADSLQFIQGYYVYRAEGYGMEFRQVSAYLPPVPTVWLDTTAALRGDATYMYTIVAENTSHIRSVMSDTVYATPDIPIPVPAPQGITARVDQGRVYLTWKTQNDVQMAVSGYRVFRREADGGWKPVADTLQDAEQNFMLDENTKPGGRYDYAVRAYSIRGDSSALSSIASALIPLPEVYPPSNLKAYREGVAVVLQWDEVVQSGAKEFRVYRYTRGAQPRMLATLPLETRVYLDDKPGGTSPVYYYITTVGTLGHESAPGKEVAVR
jgi:fibronectin type 3 domain-containing protein